MISTLDTPIAPEITLATIEELAKHYSGSHEVLAHTVSELEQEIAAIKRKYNAKLKSAVSNAAASKWHLHAAISSAPHLFEKPRTHTFHGVKVGFQKGKGGIEFDDAEKVVSLIRKTFGEDAPAYLLVKESPDKKMLAELPVSELKKLGCTVGDTGDQVVIKSTDSDIEKAVAALLKDATEVEVA